MRRFGVLMLSACLACGVAYADIGEAPTNVFALITKPAGVALTNEFDLNTAPPSIEEQPVSRTVNPGQSVTFTLTATGMPPLSYQWRKGGVDIADATDAIYTIASAQESDEGNYRCVVNNVAGSVSSDPATLTVNDPPVITAQPQSVTVNPGQNAVFSITANGTAPLSYQWKKGGVNIATGTGSSYTRSSAQQSDEDVYTCTVSNVAGSVTSAPATLTVTDPPVFTAQPQSLTVNVGATASFGVTVTGTPPLSYQWRKGTADISGATNATFSIASTQTSDEGTYRCVVKNVANPTGAISDAATLAVNTPPQITA
ncbi:MAG TPA: immunoglobulin domain-containing protein, partial [Candidatus Latescibacteria bacterium]|nr:immunoglobulin domain-containing protein [Candidatus Latescibacterota bacterium]